ncbi:MAG: sigma-70 family RNA polymerase sigma factor [Bacteroidales bacterium]|nr:sigma-70 family RNA polymerase sigma factor [Bacteroidales bacterium]
MQNQITIKEKFNKVYCENMHKVRHFCFSYIPDEAICKDITQDVFETLWNRKEYVDLDNDILPYLLIIAKNKCLNAIARVNVKKKYTQRKNSSSRDDINSFALNELTVSNLYSKEIRQIYIQALESMPSPVRQTYLKIRVERLKYKKAAEIENVSVKTIERRITIATSILRKFLRDYIKIIVLITSGLFNL